MMTKRLPSQFFFAQVVARGSGGYGSELSLKKKSGERERERED